MWTAKDILNRLDFDAGVDHGVWFPDFEHAYYYHVDARLNVYADHERWAIIIEQLAVNPRAGWPDSISTTLYYHGNCVVIREDSGWHDKPLRSVCVVANGRSGPLFTEQETINLDARDVTIREQVFPICTDHAHYAACEVDVEVLQHSDIDRWIRELASIDDAKLVAKKIKEYEERRADVGQFRLQPWHLLRAMPLEHRDHLLATEHERRQGLPEGIPLLLQLRDWKHPDLWAGERPSDSLSFRMIAEVIADRDPSRYKPVSGNVHWFNWPRSGWL